MTIMREIEDHVLDSPIILTSAYDKLVEKFRTALLARQHFQPQLVQVYQPKIMSEGELPKSPSDSANERDDALYHAQTILVNLGASLSVIWRSPPARHCVGAWWMWITTATGEERGRRLADLGRRRRAGRSAQLQRRTATPYSRS